MESRITVNNIEMSIKQAEQVRTWSLFMESLQARKS